MSGVVSPDRLDGRTATVAVLASDRAAFITGTTIDVDGGLHLR